MGAVSKRNRHKGHYICSVGQCGKVLNRLDHLRRHERSHDITQRFQCMFPGCGRFFTRNDVRWKHYQKHGEECSVETRGDVSPCGSNQSTENDMTINTSCISINLSDTSASNTESCSDTVATLATSKSHPREPDVDATLLSFSDLIEWFYVSDSPHHDKFEYLGWSGFENTHAPCFRSAALPQTELEKMFAIAPNFPDPMERRYVDDSIMQELINLIPSLATQVDFGKAEVVVFLEIYWHSYHPQYPMLHRPSFSTKSAHPLLLLCMIMIGAHQSVCIPSNSSCNSVSETVRRLKDPHKLALEIAGPLRRLIMANPQCKPPAKIWVVQCLMLLEEFEISSSTRDLHERAYLYQGAKVQLLRRSPILGGYARNIDEQSDTELLAQLLQYQQLDAHWEKWIEAESFKRATFMAFYLDILHAINYGHLITLFTHQIHLTLPCDEVLWEFESHVSTTTPATMINHAHAPSFHNALRKILKQEKVDTNSFGKKILLAGLLSIMFQLLERNIRLSSQEWKEQKKSWKDTVSSAIDIWRTTLCNDDCCKSDNSVFMEGESHNQQHIPLSLDLNDTRCKFSIYHMSQIYLRISHHDYIAYAGAPTRMNVQTSPAESEAASKRVWHWARSDHGRICVVHAYFFLWEMLLVKDSDDMCYAYDPNKDALPHRKNIVVSCLLVLFAYTFSLEGPEIASGSSESFMVEDGYRYLIRIRSHFLAYHAAHARQYSYHDSISNFASILHQVPHKNRLVGLFTTFADAYRHSNWELGQEYARLLNNCIARCRGSLKITWDELCSGAFYSTDQIPYHEKQGSIGAR